MAILPFLLATALAFPQAYQSLNAKDYDAAIAAFRAGLRLQPENAAAHKDLAYTLLKTGDNAEARDEFAAALKLNANDETAALEFAFLAFETGEPVEARRTFDLLRKRGTAATRATAEQAFQNIDGPLAAGIARWKEALNRAANPKDPALFSAHWELAELAEHRDELDLAAEQYAICFKLKPERADILIPLSRCWQQLNRLEDAHAALLAASRCPQPRTAETALEQIGSRYPYPYEFVNALALTPRNVELRRELAFLYLALGKQPEAIDQFRQVLAISPSDQLSRDQLDALSGAKKSPTTTSAARPDENKTMGLKSLALGYSRDAIHYLRLAHEDDPDDGEVILKLGFAYNYAKDDAEAIRWFDRARNSSDRGVAAEAQKAYRNLTQSPSGLTTVWSLPMYSSRWRDVFEYGQVKHNLLGNKWMTLYGSMRFSGDWKSNFTAGEVAPQYLSDSAVVFGVGIASKTWHHLTAWAEAGEAVKYLPFRHDEGNAMPDYRGGVNFAKGFGHMLGSSSAGTFFETTGDAVYVSRYGHDWIFTTQNRGGRTIHLGVESAQVLWNVNLLHDLKNQYWAETVETGPGARFHMAWMPANVYFSTDFLRGAYTNNAGNPHRPNYNDIRVGLWYARTK